MEIIGVPIGLFYSSIVGGVVMSLFALLCLTDALLFFLGLFFWPILWAVCIIWSCVAISIHNNNLIEEYDDSSSKKKQITQQSTDILNDTEGIARFIFSLLVIQAFIYLILKLLNLKF